MALRPEPISPSPVAIRPIRDDDHARLSDSHERLSPESRYRRFLATKPHLTRADVSYLVDVDGCDHFALVATRPDAEDERIVGVARFIRLPEDRTVAEMAVVIGDAHQRQGLGSELVAELARSAVARGVLRFRATMLSGNVGIRRLLENLADGPVQYRMLGQITEMDLALPGAGEAGADCGSTVLAAAAG